MERIYEMFREQLKDAVSAEKQAIKGMRRTLRKASEPALREGIEAHIAQSELHRERTEQALRALAGKPGRKLREAMRGLVEEAQQTQEEHDRRPILDLVIVAALQRIEHYEIASYGTMAEFANALEETDLLPGADAVVEAVLDEGALAAGPVREGIRELKLKARRPAGSVRISAKQGQGSNSISGSRPRPRVKCGWAPRGSTSIADGWVIGAKPDRTGRAPGNGRGQRRGAPPPLPG
jgi:ferritin-like metal-binding protein YciE